MKSKWTVRCAAAAAVAALGTAGSALAQNAPPWNEDFETFNVGDRVCGNHGWECWDQNPGVDAVIVGNPVHGGGRAIRTALADGFDSDTIAVFKDQNGNPNVTTGKWELIAWIFVPDSPAINNSGFVVQNRYNHGGPYAWSVQLRFNNQTDQVLSEFDGATLPLIENEWVRIRVEIDLTDEFNPDGWQKCWYGDDLLYEKTWNCGVGACGDRHFGSIDLWAASQPAVYYDDLSLLPLEGGEPCGQRATLNAKCKGGGSKVIASLKRADANTDVTFTVDNGDPINRNTGRKGKAKAKWSGLDRGGHTVNVCDLEDRC